GLQCAGLTDIAGEDPAAFGKATDIQDQAQGYQRTIAALFLRAATFGLFNVTSHPFEIGVREIVQRYCLSEAEQGLRRSEQVGFQRIPVFEKRVRTTIELLQAHPLIVVTGVVQRRVTRGAGLTLSWRMMAP